MAADTHYAPYEKFLERLKEEGVIALPPLSGRTGTEDLYKIDPEYQADFAELLKLAETNQANALAELRDGIINGYVTGEYLGEFRRDTGNSVYEIADDDVQAFINGPGF